MKIDVDGFELNVLAGARQTLGSKRIKNMQLEFCDYWLSENGSSCQQLYSNVLDLGFQDVHGQADFGPNCIVDRFFRLVKARAKRP